METKSIEERANNYSAKLAHERHTPNYILGGYDGYVKGATDQQEIDIQRAVEWIKENTLTGRHEMDCGRHTEEYYEVTYYGKMDELIEEFKQAMKGE